MLAHCQNSYKELGPIVANAKGRYLKEVLEEYENLLMRAMKKSSNRKKNLNVLEHILGFFKKTQPDSVRKSLHQTIEDYRMGYVGLIVPLTLMRHYAELDNNEWLKDQVYLMPHPKELALISKLT